MKINKTCSMFIMIFHQTAMKQRFCRDTCTHTSGPGKWKVELGDNYSVEKVWIRNRIDCCSERLDEVEVYSCYLQLNLPLTISLRFKESLFRDN